MRWLENVRKKSSEEKIRLIWIILIICATLLVILWVATSRIKRSLPSDTSLFQQIDQGIKNIRDTYKK